MNLKNTFSKYFLLLSVFGLIIFTPLISLAQPGSGQGSTPSGSSVKIQNPIKADNIQDFIKTILEGVIRLGIPLIALAIIYSGFLFVAAQGKPEKIKEAKDALLYTVIGAAVLLGAWAIAQLISETVLAL